MRRALLALLFLLVATQSWAVLPIFFSAGDGTSNPPPTDTTAPAAPSGLGVTENDTELVLTWTAPAETDYEFSEVRYKLTTSGTWIEWAPNPTTNSVTITSLVNGSTYDLDVRHCDDEVVPNCSARTATTGTPAAATSTSWKDTFNRADNTNIDIGSPGWNVYTSDADCTLEIVSNELASKTASATNCDNAEWYALAKVALPSPNMAAIVRLGTDTNWSSNRGPRLIFRAPDATPGVGEKHLQCRCTEPLCADGGRCETADGIGNFYAAHSDNGDCDANFGDIVDSVSGDYFGASVEGFDTALTFKWWRVDGASPPGGFDTTDASTWGDPDCTFTTSLTTGDENIIDTGLYAGIGVHSTGLDSGASLTFDEMTATNDLTAAPVAPDAPTGIAASGDAELVVTGTDNGPGTTEIKVFYCSPSVCDPGAGTEVSNPQFPVTITGLVNGTAYDLYVQACNAYGCSPNSSPTVTATPAATPVTTPTGLSVVAGDGVINWNWADDPSSALDHYEVQYCDGSSCTPDENVSPNPSVSAASQSELTNGTVYESRVRSCSSVDSSVCSSYASFDPVTPTTSTTQPEARCLELVNDGDPGTTCIGSEPLGGTNALGDGLNDPNDSEPPYELNKGSNGGAINILAGGNQEFVPCSDIGGLNGPSRCHVRNSGSGNIRDTENQDITGKTYCMRIYHRDGATAVTPPNGGNNNFKGMEAGFTIQPGTDLQWFKTDSETGTMNFRPIDKNRAPYTFGKNTHKKIDIAAGGGVTLKNVSDDGWGMYELCMDHDLSATEVCSAGPNQDTDRCPNAPTPPDNNVQVRARLCRLSDCDCDEWTDTSTGGWPTLGTGGRTLLMRFKINPGGAWKKYSSHAMAATKDPADGNFWIGYADEITNCP